MPTAPAYDTPMSTASTAIAADNTLLLALLKETVIFV